MIYPAYVHLGDAQHAHGVTLPDFEGCFSAADSYAEIPLKIQEALELYFEGENLEIPAASEISALEASGDFTGGVWMLVDIDVGKLASRPQRLNVSLPSHIVKKMDEYAARNHLTRSALIVKATEKLLASQGD
jgi:predicted RNase H-like HicB family nuclease